MKQTIRRYLSAILCIAMVFTMMPVSASVVNAEAGAEADAAVLPVTNTLNAELVVPADGSQNYNDDISKGEYFCAVTEPDTTDTGNAYGAAFEAGVTASAKGGSVGGNRQLGLAFKLPTTEGSTEAIDPDRIANATLTINVTRIHSYLGSRWTKAGIFQVDGTKASYDAIKAAYDAAGNTRVINQELIKGKNGYTKAATVYSKEQISSSNLGKKTFDVTEWVKASLKSNDPYAIFRLQPVIVGFYMNFQGANAPTLSITTATDQEAVNQAAADIKVPSRASSSFTLPTTGFMDSKIQWTSSNTDLISVSPKGAATVTRPAEDTEVTLTARVTKENVVSPGEGDASATKTFTVLVRGIALEDQINFPNRLMHFSFDDDLLEGKTDGSVMVSGDDAGQTVTATASGTGVSIDTNDKKTGDGSLRLQNNSYLTVMGSKDNLLVDKEQLTFSFWYKTTNDNANWPFYASKDNLGSTAVGNAENYIGMLMNAGTTFERYYQGRSSASINVGTVNNRNWHYVTVVMDKDSSQLYLDGALKSTREKAPSLTDILTASSRLQIGKANWGNGEYYNGWIDEFDAWDGALTARQVKTQYLSLTGQKTATINFVCADSENVVVESFKEPWPEGADSYTYVLEDSDKQLVANDKAHIRAAASEQNLTATSENPVITIKYVEPDASGIVGEYTASCHKGIAPRNLPAEVEVAYEGTEVTFMRPVDWNIQPTDYAELGEKTITATVEGQTATLKLTVKDMDADLIAHYDFEDETDFLTDALDSSRKGTKKGSAADSIVTVDGVVGKALSLPGGNRGSAYVELPDDLLQVDGKTARDFTISMFTKRNDKGWKWPMALLSSSQDSYLALINMGEDGGGDFRVESHSSNGNITIDNLNHADYFEWTHVVIIANSTEHTLTFYRDGQLVNQVRNANWDVANLAVAAAKNELGHSPYAADKDYNGWIDEFKIYNCVLEESEIKEITNEVLHRPQIANAKAKTKIEFAEGDNKDSVTQNLVLPTDVDDFGTIVTWESGNPNVIAADGTVMRPSSARGDQTVKLKVTFTINGCTETDSNEFTVTVKALPGLSFASLKKAIADAQTVHHDAINRNIYNTASVAALSQAIADALEVAEIENTYTEATEELQNKIDEATEAVQEAAAKPLVLKTLAELENSAMVGWYPLTEDAENHVGNYGNGTPGSNSVKFSRADGVTFKGGSALSEAIQISTADYEISESMTISFWAYDQGDSKSNAIGFGSGTGTGGITRHLFLVNTNDGGIRVGMQTDRWVAGRQVTTPTETKKWQHIVCVFNGKYLDLYVNGEPRLTNQDMGIDLVKIWNADPTTRHFYIGNCGYAFNGDKDYTGSIKDVRLYNTNLAEGQIDMLGEYMDNLPIEYAKSDLLTAMGSRSINGKNRVNITTENINLPDALEDDGYEVDEITWSIVSDDNGLIDIEHNKAKLPDTPETVIVKATISLVDIKESFDVDFEFLVGKPAADVNTRALIELLDEIDKMNLDEHEYLPSAWNRFSTIHAHALSVAGFAQSQAEVNQTVIDLQEALDALLEAKRGDRTALIKLLQEASDLKDSQALPYPQAAREALQNAIYEARAVRANTNATQDMVDDAVAKLSAALETFEATVGPELRPADETYMNDLASAIQDAKDAIKNGTYTDMAIAKLQEVIDAAEALAEQENLMQKDILDAIAALEAAIADLKDSGTAAAVAEKAVLTAAIAAAKSRDISSYTEVSQKAYSDAVAKVEAAAGKDGITKGDIDKALADLDAAKEAIEYTATAASEADRGNLSISILRAANSDMSDYPQSAVNAYTDKLNELRKTALKEGLTKGDIDQALADLDAATAALEATKGQKDPDKTALNKAITDAEKLNEKDYTAATWKTFKDALDAAKAVAGNASATQTQIDDAKKALDEASGKLAKVPSTTVTNKTKSLVVGETYKITKSGYSYKTANKSIATVSTKGVVTAKKDGKVVVTATSKDKKAEIRYTITVKKAPSKIAKVTYKVKGQKKAKNISLKKNKGTITLKKGKSATLNPTLPKKTYSKFKYTLSGKNAKKLASVSSKGVVKAKKKGTVKVKIETLNKKSVTITVKIK